MLRRSSLQWTTATAFVVCGAALFATLFVAVVHLQVIQEAEGRLRESERTVDAIEGVQRQLLAAESGLRGYLLTADVEHLAPYHAARDRLADDTLEVQRRVDRHLGTGVADPFVGDVEAQTDLLADLLSTFELQGGRAVMHELEAGAGRAAARRVASSLRLLLDEAAAADAVAQEQATAARIQATRSVVGGGLLAAISFLLAIVGSITDNQRLRSARAEARDLAALLSEQEDIALRVNAAHDVESLLGIAAHEGRRLTRTEVFAVVLFEPRAYAVDTSSRAEALSTWDPTLAPPRVLPPLSSLGRTPIAVAGDRDRNGPPELSAPDDIEVVNAVPIPAAHADHTIGVLIAAEPWHELGEPERVVLSSLARTVGVAIANVRLLNDLREEASRREAFIGLLGHELRNPLNGIAGAAQLLERSGGDDIAPRTQQLVSMVARQSRQMRRLVDDLLDVERIRVGKMELNRRDYDVCQLLRDTIDEVRTADKRGTVIRLHLPDDPVVAWLDRARLSQCVHNLLDNARRYLQSEGAIDVTLASHGDDLCIIIEDEGTGIDAKVLPSLFERFEQGSNSNGLGLGLSLVRGLVEQHGGQVSAANRPEGGARFTIRLPATLHEPPSASGEPPRGLNDLKVVVIDDRADARTVLEQLFTEEGHRVHCADNGRSGLALIHEVRPDVVLCDIGLGHPIDGMEVARRLRADPRHRHLPLIAVTGYSTDRARQQVLQAGFDRHLAKPLDLDSVLEAVDELLHTSAAS